MTAEPDNEIYLLPQSIILTQIVYSSSVTITIFQNLWSIYCSPTHYLIIPGIPSVTFLTETYSQRPLLYSPAAGEIIFVNQFRNVTGIFKRCEQKPQKKPWAMRPLAGHGLRRQVSCFYATSRQTVYTSSHYMPQYRPLPFVAVSKQPNLCASYFRRFHIGIIYIIYFY